MFDRIPFKADLRGALVQIERDAVYRVRYPKKYRLWTYDELAALAGEVADWKCEGAIRNALYGSESRRWLQEEHRLFWKSDQVEHLGLMFTADPRTGIEWERRRIAADAIRRHRYLLESAQFAERAQSTFRSHFRKIARGAQKGLDSGLQLQALGDQRLLAALGVPDTENGMEYPNGKR